MLLAAATSTGSCASVLFLTGSFPVSSVRIFATSSFLVVVVVFVWGPVGLVTVSDLRSTDPPKPLWLSLCLVYCSVGVIPPPSIFS